MFRPRRPWFAVWLAWAIVSSAVGQAPDSESVLRGRIEDDVAAAEAALAELDRFEAGLAATAVRERLDRVAELELRAAELKPGAADAVQLYRSVTEELIPARARLRRALAELDGRSNVPRFQPALDLDAARQLEGSSVTDAVPRLESLLLRVETREAEVADAEIEMRWEALTRERELVQRLNEVRITALDKLPARERARLLGVSRDGVRQLQREVEHLLLSARSYLVLSWHEVRTLPGGFTDVFAIGSAAATLLRLALVLAVLVWIFRRTGGWIEHLSRWLGDRATRRTTRLRVEGFFRIAAVAAPWLVLWFGLRGVSWALADAAAREEVLLLLRLARLWIGYRLAVDLFVAVIVAIVRLYRFEFGAKRTKKLLESARALLRVIFFVLVLLALSEQFVGRGYLYHVVVKVAGIAVVVSLIVIFRRWQEDVAAAYLYWGARGRLRERVERSKGSWIGGLAALVALALLAGQAALRMARDFAMGFDQTRRALAFLFRRRIEKRAELAGYADTEGEPELPAAVLDALSEDPLGDERLAVDYFPGLDRAHEAIASWGETGRGGSFLLTGHVGVGRTSWLARVRSDEFPVRRITFDRRIGSDTELAKAISTGIGLEELDSRRDLRDRLNELPRCVLIVDRGQNLFLGKVGGYDGFEAFVTLVEETSERVFWIISFSQLAWSHISAVHPDLTGFRHSQVLPAWPEEKIAELIRARAAAGGATVVYDDLLVDANDRVTHRDALADTAEGFSRLLWDSCLGLPRIALHYWRRSLVPDPKDPKRVRVRLFRTPPLSALEERGDVALFLLAALTVHESLTTRELSVVTRYPARLCRLQMARLEGLGVVRREGIRWWATSYWQPTILRLLKRRNLLVD